MPRSSADVFSEDALSRTATRENREIFPIVRRKYALRASPHPRIWESSSADDVRALAGEHLEEHKHLNPALGRRPD